MSFEGLLKNIVEGGLEPEAPQDSRGGFQEKRAMLARSHRTSTKSPIKRNPQIEATLFVKQMAKRFSVTVNGYDEDSLRVIDSFIEQALKHYPEVIDNFLCDRLSSWFGEYTRHNQGFRWTDDALLTNGQVTFDPRDVIAERLRADMPS